jgi:hypothetical protein
MRFLHPPQSLKLFSDLLIHSRRMSGGCNTLHFASQSGVPKGAPLETRFEKTLARFFQNQNRHVRLSAMANTSVLIAASPLKSCVVRYNFHFKKTKYRIDKQSLFDYNDAVNSHDH